MAEAYRSAAVIIAQTFKERHGFTCVVAHPDEHTWQVEGFDPDGGAKLEVREIARQLLQAKLSYALVGDPAKRATTYGRYSETLGILIFMDYEVVRHQVHAAWQKIERGPQVVTQEHVACTLRRDGPRLMSIEIVARAPSVPVPSA
jgi:hypothetical protein